MSLEKAMETLAVAMERQAAILEKIAEAGVAFVATSAQLPDGAAVSTASGKNEKKPAEDKPTRGKAAAAKPTPPPADEGDDGDDWDDGEEQEEVTYTAADVREAILKVRDKGGEKANAEQAKEILKKIGAKSPSEIKEADYAKVMELCNKALAKK